MAKKVLTPEEVQTKMEKKSAKRKLFFGTFTKALAFFLAIAMAYSLAIIAFTPATAPAASGNVQSGQQSGGESTDGDDLDIFDDVGSSSTGDSGSASTGDSGSSSTGGNGSASTPSGDSGSSNSGMSKDEQKKLVADAMNAATAKAAKGSYEMERVCKYQSGKGIKVTMFGGDATSVLNSAIQVVDKKATLDSVVGGFLGIGTKNIKVTNGVGQRYGSDGTMADLTNEEKDYMLKAMKLSASDIENVKISDNVYTFSLAKIADPQKDNSNPMHKATNDFITESQVQTAISSLTDAIKVESANVSYYSILFVATMDDSGNLKKLEMSYKADAVMKLKVGVAIDGSGSMEVNTVYNF